MEATLAFLKNVKSFGWETSVFPYQKLVSNTDGYEFFEELGNAGSKISKNDRKATPCGHFYAIFMISRRSRRMIRFSSREI